MECFRNPSRDTCASVKSYMINLKSEKDDILNTEYALNIIEAIRAASWNIKILDFRNGEINSSIYTANPPSVIKEIKLSYNIPLKQSIVSIPDNFIRYLTACPFQSFDGITVSNCSAKLNSLCGSNINCKNVQSNSNSNNNSNTNNNNNNNNEKDNNNNNNNTNNNTNNNNNNNSNHITNDHSAKPSNKNDKNNNNESKDNQSMNNDEIKLDNSITNNGDINNKVNSHEPDIEDNESNKNNTKSLIETFMFGLLTSVGILVFLLIFLCLVQSYSNKNIMNLKKISEYYENKPLVNHSGKTNSSSMNENASNNGTQSTHSNYAFSSSSQASYSNPKHKRYLYVFDDGSVMMSKSLHQNNRIIQSNASTVSNNPINSNQVNHTSVNFNHNSLSVNNHVQTLHPRNSNNNNNTLPHTSKLSISTAISTPNSNATLSPMIGSPIIESPVKAANRNTISIQIPPQSHENNFRQEKRKSAIPFTTLSQ
ncbi:hypothetical protein BCR36DRAFT_584811 [Piromyces finnis]|uniref:Uncharacterized protein n=1 Tax=Piromyces finnis TaxID=1754191 RepID=A0A1Y1V6K4_9FUNG|nr:hypothetical protein BCR36DRAFT_584811 [Piromyces finnis]|eukprot:ORX47302.1 hypothetical protein BCR36DRAFT_584811 [Piromyces finnis]